MPGLMARAKSILGSQKTPTLTIVASQTALELPHQSNVFLITAGATETIGTVNANRDVECGRIVYIIAADDTSAVTFTNDDTPTARGQMDLGGSDVVLDDRDVLCLIQREDGSWLRMFNTNN